MKVFFSVVLYCSVFLETIRSTIILGTSYQCNPLVNPTQFEMNFLTDQSFYLGCSTKIMIVDLFDSTNDYVFNLPSTSSPYANKIIAISNKKKNPPNNVDKLFVAFSYLDSSVERGDKVYYLPKYYQAKNNADPFEDAKIFQIPVKIAGQRPTIKFLEAIPENDFFITADDRGSIHVIDSSADTSPDLYPSNSIYFHQENGSTIIGLKYRDLLSKFFVGVSGGEARIYVFNLVNSAPTTINHGGELSAIETFKFDDRVMTGGADGLIKVWNSTDQSQVGVTYNIGKAYGDKVNDLSWIISTNFFVSCHNDKKINVFRMQNTESHLDTYNTISIPIYISSVENTKEFLVGFSGSIGLRRYSSNSIGCHVFCKSCSGSTKYECHSCFNGYTPNPSTAPFFCSKNCNLNNKEYFDLDSNTCKSCADGCQKCTRERPIDCIQCESSYLQHPNNACYTECQIGTYANPDTTNQTCLSCHPSCKKCNGSLYTDCLECKDGLVENIDKTCTPQCKTATYNITATKCAQCHSSCKNCEGPELNQCTECYNSSRYFLNSERKCIDCLDSYEQDLDICNFTRPLKVVRCPYESKDPFSSITIKF